MADRENRGAATSNKTAQIEIHADSLECDQKTGWATARGHVIIHRGEEELRADYVNLNMKTEDTQAAGNVIMNKAGSVWKGDKLKGNFKTGVWDAAGLAGNMAPFQVKAVKTDKTTNNV